MIQSKKMISVVMATTTCLISAMHLDQNDFDNLQHLTKSNETELRQAIKFMEQQERHYVPSFRPTYGLIPDLVHKHGLRTVCEVGVAFGTYSEAILQNSHVQKMYSVDPYKHFSGSEYDDSMNYSQLQFDVLFYKVQKLLASYGDRSIILRMTSEQASETFEDESLDLVYLDANHAYGPVKQDLHLWFDKIRSGGFICGDDYHAPGVRKAVQEFFGQKNLEVKLRAPRNWYVQKP